MTLHISKTAAHTDGNSPLHFFFLSLFVFTTQEKGRRGVTSDLEFYLEVGGTKRSEEEEKMAAARAALFAAVKKGDIDEVTRLVVELKTNVDVLEDAMDESKVKIPAEMTIL